MIVRMIIAVGVLLLMCDYGGAGAPAARRAPDASFD